MNGRLLIWGYGRVGSAITKQVLLQRSINASILALFDSVHVISSKTKPQNLEGLDWLNSDIFIADSRLIISPGDVILLTVSDSQIAQCAARLDVPGITVVHCSGATPLPLLSHADTAVFYPLQTFASDVTVNWSDVPVFTESSSEQVNVNLQRLADSLGVLHCQALSYASRQYLHLAGVFANNFTVAMAGIAHDILASNDLPTAWIQPILAQTAMNLGSDKPWEKLTGPAKRGDLKTQENHIYLLDDQQNLQALYKLMSEYIQAKNKTA